MCRIDVGSVCRIDVGSVRRIDTGSKVITLDVESQSPATQECCSHIKCTYCVCFGTTVSRKMGIMPHEQLKLFTMKLSGRGTCAPPLLCHNCQQFTDDR